MKVRYSDDAIEDIAYWKRSDNKAVQKKITQLILDTLEHPLTGLGKPEQLHTGMQVIGVTELLLCTEWCTR